jgi:hypothetical protein
MIRTIPIFAVLFAVSSVFANENLTHDSRQMFIATTGRIISINPAARTIRVRAFTVVTTSDTVFQDGADPLRFDDFKAGEMISIHGVLKGSTLVASRVAKWS